MILVKPETEILTPLGINALYIERFGRVAYKSEDAITETSYVKFVRNLIKRGHESVLEHVSVSVKFICDRGVSHELVRHRLASFTQESTRYCNYKSGVTFVIPPWLDIRPEEIKTHSDILYECDTFEYYWLHAMLYNEEEYKHLLNCSWTPQMARSVLPNSLKTEVIMTCNVREWRHVLKLRTAKDAHPQMREVMIDLLYKFKECASELFEDIVV